MFCNRKGYNRIDKLCKLHEQGLRFKNEGLRFKNLTNIKA